MNTSKFAVLPALVALVLAVSANAAAKETLNYRLTIVNNSNETIIFTVQWDGKASESVTLDPGKKYMAQTKIAPKAKKPTLTATYVPAPGIKADVKTLQSSRLNTTSANSGLSYSFQNLNTNLGPMVDLRPQ